MSSQCHFQHQWYEKKNNFPHMVLMLCWHSTNEADSGFSCVFLAALLCSNKMCRLHTDGDVTAESLTANTIVIVKLSFVFLHVLLWQTPHVSEAHLKTSAHFFSRVSLYWSLTSNSRSNKRFTGKPNPCTNITQSENTFSHGRVTNKSSPTLNQPVVCQQRWLWDSSAPAPSLGRHSMTAERESSPNTGLTSHYLLCFLNLCSCESLQSSENWTPCHSKACPTTFSSNWTCNCEKFSCWQHCFSSLSSV